jgi:signal transduction histidine kinase
MGRSDAGVALRSGLARLGSHLGRGAAAYGVLIIALLLTGLAWYYVRQNVEEQTQVRFDETTRATQEAIERRTKAYLDAIFGARGLFYASQSVDREEWDSYVRGIEPEDRLKGLQALGFAEYVEPGEREAFVQKVRGEGLPRLSPDLKPGGERPAYFPLKFVAPSNEPNRRNLNLDVYADPAHRTAMDQARDSGSPRATGTVFVLTEPAPGSSADLALREGFAVYLPVYREGEPQNTVAERRLALRGFVVGFFEWDGLLDGVFGGGFDPAIDFELYDSQDVASSLPLYDSDGLPRAGNRSSVPLFSEESRIGLAGREWSLYFATLPGFEEGAGSDLPLFVLASGVAVSFLLFGITWMLVRSRTLAERASRDLEETNRELEGANKELEAFSYSVSHDLRAPLRSIEGFSQILLEDHAQGLDEEARGYLGRVRASSRRMALLIDDLLDLSRVTRSALRRQTVDLSALAREIAVEIQKSRSDREARFVTAEGLVAEGDARLLRVALENLLGNAFKFTSKKEVATIEFGTAHRNDEVAYYVRDDGVGFDPRYAEKLFGAFQRLHGADEFEGTGIGLATVARIVHRHGGRVWAEGAVGEGATFFFTLSGGHRQGASLPSRKAGVL